MVFCVRAFCGNSDSTGARCSESSSSITASISPLIAGAQAGATPLGAIPLLLSFCLQLVANNKPAATKESINRVVSDCISRIKILFEVAILFEALKISFTRGLPSPISQIRPIGSPIGTTFAAISNPNSEIRNPIYQ